MRSQRSKKLVQSRRNSASSKKEQACCRCDPLFCSRKQDQGIVRKPRTSASRLCKKLGQRKQSPLCIKPSFFSTPKKAKDLLKISESGTPVKSKNSTCFRQLQGDWRRQINVSWKFLNFLSPGVRKDVAKKLLFIIKMTFVLGRSISKSRYSNCSKFEALHEFRG